MQFEMRFAKKRILKRGAVPTIYDPLAGNPMLAAEREKRIQKRENKKIVKLLLQKDNVTARNLTLHEENIENDSSMVNVPSVESLPEKNEKKIIEYEFGVIRAKGGLHDHPDQMEFKFRLRSYILGRNKGVISHGANVEVDNTPNIEISQPPHTGIILRIAAPNCSEEETEIVDFEYDGLENFAGYIFHKLRSDLPNIAVPAEKDVSFYSWVDHLSKGGLSKPTAEMMGAYMTALEKIFVAINGDGLLITNNFVKKHIEQASEINCDIKIKKLFFRARMFFKIRKPNKDIQDNAYKRKRKLCNTVT